VQHAARQGKETPLNMRDLAILCTPLQRPIYHS
jgi:hypothetical protein